MSSLGQPHYESLIIVRAFAIRIYIGVNNSGFGARLLTRNATLAHIYIRRAAISVRQRGKMLQ